jgi:hypothetical protein
VISNELISAIFLTPSSTCLRSTQFSTLNSAGINDPEGPEKYNNTEVKYGAAFNSFHRALVYTEAILV